MSITEVTNQIKRAIDSLPLHSLQTAETLLETAIEQITPVAFESSDFAPEETRAAWEDSAEAIRQVTRSCIDLRPTLDSYLANLLGQHQSTDIHDCSSGAPVRDAPTEIRSTNAIVDDDKFRYFFGETESTRHNHDRSSQNSTELKRIGINNTRQGRDVLREHLESVLESNSNIKNSYRNQYGAFQIRDSLLAGPGGFVAIESTWHVTRSGFRLITLVPRRGR